MRRKKENLSFLGVELTGGLDEKVTAWGGASLLVDLGRRCGAMDTAEGALPKKKSAKGLTQRQAVESFVLLSALGGDCVEDMERLRSDEGLVEILGYTPPAAETARQWLDRFHDEGAMAQRPEQGSFLPKESGSLEGLREVERRVVWAYTEAVDTRLEVTLDVDAQLVETSKSEAKYCYDGYKAFQPMEVEWAETKLVLADEFREGNVPASKDIKRLVDEAYGMLPQKPWRVSVRSDSAAYDQDNLDHWDQKGWRFAVSADMSVQLRAVIEALPEESWKVWKEEKKGMMREWAEVPYVPSRKQEKKESRPYRYVGIRIRWQQMEMLDDGSRARHFAVVTNIWDMEGQDLLEWHRKKAGTIEHIHHVLNNELAAGVYPSAKHGANAAWLRLQVITYNLLELLKVVALPAEYAKARPKRLRFTVFTQCGRIVHHAGQTLLHIGKRAWEELIRLAYDRLLRLHWESG